MLPHSIRSRFLWLIVLSLLPLTAPQEVLADDPPSAVGSMLNLLKSGRVPEARLGAIVKLICDRGNEHDLRYIFDQIVESESWSADLKLDALRQLSEASSQRKLKPAGDLSGIQNLLAAEDRQTLKLGIELSGQWGITGAFERLADLATQANADQFEVQRLALGALTRISSEQARPVLTQLANSAERFPVRAAAISQLARIDAKTAAALGAKALAAAGERDDPGPLLDGFLDQEGGSAALATAVQQAPPAPDLAKLALRHMFAIGRTDAELTKVLSEVAGIAGEPKIPEGAELAALIAEVEQQGDAARGEAVFRRNDLSCLKCHAVSKAGGQIGPDLSAIGASSPADYVILSVLDPDQAIKEAYTTRVVITNEGRIYQGIVADRTANALVLRDAAGKETSIPVDDIDEEVEGKSLMPKGLVKFMTHAELVDLSKFLTQLGKPGNYAVRSTERVQRWKLLTETPEILLTEIPTGEAFVDLVLNSSAWFSWYARVNGELPLQELQERTGQDVVYVQGACNVTKGGAVQLQFDDLQGLTVWIDSDLATPDELASVELQTGVRLVTVRIDTAQRDAASLKLEFLKPSGSKAEFSVVDGN